MKKVGRKNWVAFGVAALWVALGGARASANVSVTSFTAQAQTSQIVLNWKTASEISNAGFNLYRSTFSAGPWTNKLNPHLIPACPGCALGANYSYTDSTAGQGQTYYYRLESVEFSGVTQPFGPASAQIAASATSTPTAVLPTATRTATLVLATATNTLIPGTPTATVYNSPTPFGTPAPTDTPFPTRVAYVVEQATLTPVPAAINKSAPPNPNSSNPAPPKANSSNPAQPSANPSPQVANDQPPSESSDSGSTDSSSEPENAPPDPSASASPSLFTFGLLGAAGIFVVFALALGAVSLYFIAHRFVR